MSKHDSSRRVRLGTLRQGAAAVACALAGVVLVSAPATADINPGQMDRVRAICPANYFCVWGDAEYYGKWIRQIQGKPRPNVGDFLNDQISSLWNRTRVPVCIYQDSLYGGKSRHIWVGNSHRNLQNDYFDGDKRGGIEGVIPNSPINDRISSWRGC